MPLVESLRKRRRTRRKSLTEFNFLKEAHDLYVRLRAVNVRTFLENNAALEIGKRKVNARTFPRKIAFLRDFKIFVYVKARQEHITLRA